MSATKALVESYAEDYNMPFDEALAALKNERVMKSYLERLAFREPMGNVFLSKNSPEEREFALVYQAGDLFLRYYKIFISPEDNGIDTYVNIKDESAHRNDFPKFWQLATPEQTKKALNAFVRAQEWVVNERRKELEQAEADLAFIKKYIRQV